jgi:16S rRNA (guanine527-N7)-methyltransferase
VQLREKLTRRAARAGLALPGTVLKGLEAYFELLRKWNERVSLTALPVREAGDEAIDRLLIEPSLAAKYLPRPNIRVIDIGSGGGSPAIPMKLVAPEISMLMVESKTRKAAFLREAIRQLNLVHTEVEWARFEELLARPELHEWADVVTLRAVKIDAKTLAAVQSFTKPGGLLFLFTTTSAPEVVPTPQLVRAGHHLLVPHLASRLEILRKIS